MGAVIELALRQEVETCCACGISFSMPKVFLDKRREDGANFYCPSGHQLSFTDSELKKAQRALEFEKNRRANAEDRALEFQAQRDSEAARANALVDRVRKGVCPCCKRSFANVRRHMASKHPEAKD